MFADARYGMRKVTCTETDLPGGLSMSYLVILPAQILYALLALPCSHSGREHGIGELLIRKA